MKGKSLEGWISRILPLDVSFDGLTQEDVDAALLDHRPVPLLFGRISTAEVLDDLRQRGLEARLAERGYHDLEARIPVVALGQEALQLMASHGNSSERLLLMELKAFWGRLSLPGSASRPGDNHRPGEQSSPGSASRPGDNHRPGEQGSPGSASRPGDNHRPGEQSSPGVTIRALVWDWLELRDPMAEYSPSRPPLPGQTAPGLAMFHDLVELMRHYVSQTEAEALVTIPQYFHNAVLYQKDPGLRYRFLDPLRQGQLVAQMRDLLAEANLCAATWAFVEDRVETLAPGSQEWVGFPWTPSELVLALTPMVKEALDRQDKDPEVEHGLAYKFRMASVPNPDIEGSFHLG